MALCVSTLRAGHLHLIPAGHARARLLVVREWLEGELVGLLARIGAGALEHRKVAIRFVAAQAALECDPAAAKQLPNPSPICFEQSRECVFYVVSAGTRHQIAAEENFV